MIEAPNDARIYYHKKAAFSVTPEQMTQIHPYSSDVSATRVAAVLNSLIDTDRMKKLRTTDITGWLLSIGLLQEIETPSGQKCKVPTPNGEMLGMKETSFTNDQGVPTQYVVYDKNAQQFILDNIEVIIAFMREKDAEKSQMI